METADGAIYNIPLATISAFLMLELLSQCSHRLGVLQKSGNEGQVHVRFGALAWGGVSFKGSSYTSACISVSMASGHEARVA